MPLKRSARHGGRKIARGRSLARKVKNRSQVPRKLLKKEAEGTKPKSLLTRHGGRDTRTPLKKKRKAESFSWNRNFFEMEGLKNLRKGLVQKSAVERSSGLMAITKNIMMKTAKASSSRGGKGKGRGKKACIRRQKCLNVGEFVQTKIAALAVGQGPQG